jgi:hypothetical protein
VGIQSRIDCHHVVSPGPQTFRSNPEYDIETARWVVQNKEGELPTERVERVLDAITPERNADTASANHVFENFEKLVRRRI